MDVCVSNIKEALTFDALFVLNDMLHTTKQDADFKQSRTVWILGLYMYVSLYFSVNIVSATEYTVQKPNYL